MPEPARSTQSHAQHPALAERTLSAVPTITQPGRERPPSDGYFERQPTHHDQLPDPGPLLENLARCAVEAIAGVRDLDQIARWVDEHVYGHLLKRVVLASRARQYARKAPVRPLLRIGATVSCAPRPGVVEATVILHSNGRSRAVAIRLEGLDRRWRATAIHVL